jgi:FixJ family two-component response regulator
MLMAIKAGASGYLLKCVDVDELVAAVKTVAMGEFIIYPSMAAKLVSHLGRVERKPVPEPSDVLSFREIEVHQLVAEGSRNSEIASQLSNTEATVKAPCEISWTSLRGQEPDPGRGKGPSRWPAQGRAGPRWYLTACQAHAVLFPPHPIGNAIFLQTTSRN